MKKPKRPQATKSAVSVADSSGIRWFPPWWTIGAAVAGLIAVFVAYGPALNGGFVLDDRSLPYYAPQISEQLNGWVGLVRPLLMLSFWIDHRLGGSDPYTFHATNVFLHFLTSMLVTLIAAWFLRWVGVQGWLRAALAVFSGALFLLHPIQTESVAYVASRSENLSVLFFFAAFAAFLYKPGDSITLLRSLAIVALFGAAVATKQHTLVLPALLLVADYFWHRGGIRKNRMLYGLLAIGGIAGAISLWQILRTTNSAGFRVEDFTPANYFFTQCRVIWIYVRMFFLPYGQNIDPDVAVSKTLFDHGAIFGLIALVAVVSAAWFYRKRYPLAAFGIFMFLLLLAPTSSFVPIKDVLAEHRLYLPFFGLVLVCLEFLRRIQPRQVIWAGMATLGVCAILTYQRSQVWENPLTLWQDSVAKSPRKYRPRFQLAFAQYENSRCQEASQSYQTASHLGPVDDQLLVDWGLALDCAGRWNEAIDKLRQAALYHDTAHVHSQIAKVYASHRQMQEALVELARAEKIDPHFDMTFVYRGKIYQLAGDRTAAARELEHALALNPGNQDARESLARVGP